MKRRWPGVDQLLAVLDEHESGELSRIHGRFPEHGGCLKERRILGEMDPPVELWSRVAVQGLSAAEFRVRPLIRVVNAALRRVECLRLAGDAAAWVAGILAAAGSLVGRDGGPVVVAGIAAALCVFAARRFERSVRGNRRTAFEHYADLVGAAAESDRLRDELIVLMKTDAPSEEIMARVGRANEIVGRLRRLESRVREEKPQRV